MSAELPVVAVDAMGGDNAPDAIVGGALRAAADGVARIILVGDRARIEPLVRGDGASACDILHTAREIAMDAPPSQAVRDAEGTSLGEAVACVRDGRAGAVVSAGNSGAFLAIALIKLRTISGIARPAIAAVLPTKKGPLVLCDAGANVDCRAEWLQQFGLMGSAYARAGLGIAQPRVGVVSVGEERAKGNTVSIEAAALLEASAVRFVGNVEGKDLFDDVVDVAVCDGFVGNVILKTAEGLAGFFRAALRDAFEQASPPARLGALLGRPAFDAMGRRLSYDTYGGAPLLGVRGNCIVSHGRSNVTAIRNAIAVAAASARGDLVTRIADAIAVPSVMGERA